MTRQGKNTEVEEMVTSAEEKCKSKVVSGGEPNCQSSHQVKVGSNAGNDLS